MVVLEAAAIGAAGYGLYKGGEAGVRKGKEAHREFKREQKRNSQLQELGQKSRSRSERISQLVTMRRSGGVGGTGNAPNASTSAPNLFATPGSSSTSFSSNPSGSSRNISVEDRHQAVMEKLRASRKEQTSTKTLTPAARFNPFKRK
jgi:hypothetical protein